MNKLSQTTLLMTCTVMSPFIYADNTDITLDGRLTDSIWQQAKSTNTFYEVVPATHKQHTDKVESKVVTTAEGVYIGIINWQGENERKKQYNLQDGFIQADFNRIYLDFSGDGSGAYLFAVALGGGIQDGVLTPQLTTDYDWDGDWQTAYHEAPEYWSTETFIPWHTVSFYNHSNETGDSEIGVSVQLYELSKNYIYASQKQTISNSDFFLEMPKVAANIPNKQQFLFVPYITRYQDLITHDDTVDTGFDFVYKPNHHQKISVAVNPDFGQVDSDEVDVNYSAVETLRTDKRPFFTQDIGVFSVPSLQDTKLIHTRRIGARSDDGLQNTTAIDAAVRFVQQSEQLQIGAFAVQEDEMDSDAGKSFYAMRSKYRHKQWQTGLLVTHTERPFLDRLSTAAAWDTQYQSGTWSLQSALLRTDVKESDFDKSGIGGSVKVGYQLSANTSFETAYLKLDPSFDVSDLGYAKRNNWRYWQGDVNHAVNINNEWISRIKHKLSVSYVSNDAGVKLPAVQQYITDLMLQNGSQISTQLTYNSEGWQDNIGYGSERFIQPSTWGSRIFYQSPYSGQFSWAASYQYDQEGFDGLAQQFALDLTFMPHENWNININNFYRNGDGWVIANKNNQISQYDRKYFANENKITGLLTDNLEVSIYFQWAILQAKAEEVFSLEGGSKTRLSGVDTSFEDKRFTSQLKFRYRLGAFSDVYLVYSRGATEIDSLLSKEIGEQSLFKSTESLWKNPDEERLTLKVRYAF